MLTKPEKKVLTAITKLGGMANIDEVARASKLRRDDVRHILRYCRLFKRVDGAYKVNSRYAYNESVGYFVEVC